MGFTGFVIWCALLAAAGLSFPRRPYLSGILFIALGGWSMFLRVMAVGHLEPMGRVAALGVGAVWFAIGIRQLMRRTA